MTHSPWNAPARVSPAVRFVLLVLLFVALAGGPAVAQESPFEERSEPAEAAAGQQESAQQDDAAEETIAEETTAEEAATEEAATEEAATEAGAVAERGNAGTRLSEQMSEAAEGAGNLVRNGESPRIPSSVEDVRETGSRAWNSYLVPVWERFVDVLPSVLKAVGLLIAFWIAAVILGWVVTRLLSMTEIDNRLARDLGLEDRMAEWEKRGTSLEQIFGTVVKWIVLLFGFVAFFDALELTMVAGPLENILDSVASALTNLLLALAYLALYWAVATVLRIAVAKSLKAVGFDERAARWIKSREVEGEKVAPSDMAGRLVFWVVLLFGLPTFLEALGQEAAVAPLRDMMTEFLAFLPNVVAALILVFIATVVATIVREIVTNFLAAAGADGFAQKFGLGTSENSRKLSEIVGAVAYFFVMIPLLVAAVDSLQIEAISEPVTMTLETVLAAIPLMIVAFLVLAVGWLVAKTARGLVESFLRGVGFDSLPQKVGLDFLMPREGSQSLSSIAGSVVMAIILVLTAQQALASLELDQFAELLGALVAYLPKLLVGLFIILAALSLGNYVAGIVSQLVSGSGHGDLAGTLARWAIYFLGFSMGLSQLGVGEDVVRIAVAAVLGGAALALGIALGLGGRDRAKEFVDGLGRGGSGTAGSEPGGSGPGGGPRP